MMRRLTLAALPLLLPALVGCSDVRAPDTACPGDDAALAEGDDSAAIDSGEAGDDGDGDDGGDGDGDDGGGDEGAGGEGEWVVVINEVVSSNDAGAVDEAGDAEDWLELYNAGDATADLSGWSLWDNDEENEPWIFPDDTELGPGEHLLVWCDGDEDDGPLHASFKLTADGEEVTLYDADEEVADAVAFPELETDTSYARVPDGSVNWDVVSAPTPEAAN